MPLTSALGTNNVKLWKSYKLLIGILALELFVVIPETFSVYRCYTIGNECWPWFFTISVNHPATYVTYPLLSTVFEWFGELPTLTEVLFTSVLYWLSGAATWFVLILVIVNLAKWLSAMLRFGKGKGERNA